jgi:hypothetical protein
MRSRIVTSALLVALAFTLAACSNAGSTPAGETSASVEASGTSGNSAQMNSSNPDPLSLLSIADVERVTGLTGVRIIEPGTTDEAIGRLNFATADGTLIATMNIGDGTAFDQSMQGMYFSELATGTGSMCFVGPSPEVSPVLTIFAAAQGDHAVIMKTFVKTEGGTVTWIPMEKLQELVDIALTRWG